MAAVMPALSGAGVAAATGPSAATATTVAKNSIRTRINPGMGSSLHRRRIEDAAIRPQRVHAPLDAERAALAEIALENLAVVPDLLDHDRQPVAGKVERRDGRRAEGDGGILPGLAVWTVRGDGSGTDAA